MSTQNLALRAVYSIADVIVVPTLRYIFRFANHRPLPSIMALWHHLLWRAKLGALGSSTCIYPHVIIHSPEKIKTGSRVAIAEFVHMWGGGGITIGDDVMIATHTVITSQTHDPDALLFCKTLKIAPVVIENNVWIVSGVIMLPGIHIGEGSVIGAGSVVIKDVPARTVTAGIPVRPLRSLGA